MPKVFSSQGATVAVDNAPLHATCHAFVSSHETVASDRGPGQYDLSMDIQSCEVMDSIQGSTANITLLPRRPYIHWLFPGDWISIYMSSGADARDGYGVVGMRERAGDDTRVFFGMLTAVRERVPVAPDTGQSQVRISISCQGIQGMFEKTAVYYNQQLGPKSLFGSMLPGLATLTMGIPLSGSPATIPRSMALAYLGFGGQLLMPKSYPAGFGSEKQRSQRIQASFVKALAIEEALGYINVRGVKGVQKATLVKRALESVKGEFQARSLAVIVDFFTYVEDLYVSGAVVNTPTHEQRGSVWGLMQENSNPIMNEMFISILPERDEQGRIKKSRGKDEWGMVPKLTPSLVLRERPFSWRNEVYEVPSGLSGGARQQVRFGDVFFSQRGRGDRFPAEQETSAKKDLLGNSLAPGGISLSQSLGGLSSSITTAALASSNRAVDRLKIQVTDIRQYELGLSDNDMFNFFMITQSAIPLTQIHQKFTLLLDGLVPIFLPESITRYGLRLRDMSTKFMYTGGGEVGSKKGLDFLVRCLMAYDNWYQHSPWYRAGTFSIRPCPMARAGMVLDVDWSTAEESFYIESVNHSFTHGENGGQLGTNLTVTRGQPSGFSDPRLIMPYAPPDPVKIFGYSSEAGGVGKEIPRVDVPAGKQPKVLRSRLTGDAEKVQEFTKVVAQFESVSILPTGTLSDYLVGLKETPEAKRTIATAKKALRFLDNKGLAITTKQIEDTIKEYDSRAKPVPLPPVHPVKQDRADAGRPPWAHGVLKNKMYSGAREFLMKVLDLMTGLFRK